MPRKGYTLLEVILAIAIGLLLIAALYVALEVQMRYMQTGRNAVAEGQLARGLLARMGADIRQHLGKHPASSAAATATATATTTTSTSATAPTTTGASGTDAAASGGGLGTTQFNYGVQGDDTQLMLYVSAVPRFGQADLDNQNGTSDLRRIVYTLMPGTGLVRIESRMFAVDDSDMPDAFPDVLAPEALALQFRYFDGSSGTWLTSWDGTASGPPLAIEITLGLQPPVDLITPRIETLEPTFYRAVVTIPTAVVDTSSTTGSTTGTTSP